MLGWKTLSSGAPSDGHCYVAEWRGHEWSLIDAATLSEKIPLYHHIHTMNSSISIRREYSPKAGTGQRIRNPWGSRVRPCESGPVSDGTSKGVHWWGAPLCSQLQPCESHVLSVPNLQSRALTWSCLEGCLLNFWSGLFARQPLQASWVLESIISGQYSRREYKRSCWHWWE